MNDAYASILNFLLKYIKYILIIIAIIIAIYIFRKKIKDLWVRLTAQKKDYTKEYIDDQEKIVLEGLAGNVHTDLLSSFWTPTSNLDTIYALSDAKLVYLLKYYKRTFGQSLYSDLKEENIVFGKGSKDQLLTRLTDLGYGF